MDAHGASPHQQYGQLWNAGCLFTTSHRVGRVLSFFSSRRNWDSPTPHMQASVPLGGAPPLDSGERNTLACGRGGRWSPNSDEGTYTVFVPSMDLQCRVTFHSQQYGRAGCLCTTSSKDVLGVRNYNLRTVFVSAGLSGSQSVRYRNEKECRCQNHSGTGIRGTHPVPQCSGTGLRCRMPECRCRRYQPFFLGIC
jgi:hypothetical protein